MPLTFDNNIPPPQPPTTRPRSHGPQRVTTRLQVRCAYCRNWTFHTSYHPRAKLAFGRHPIGAFVCDACHHYLTEFPIPPAETKPKRTRYPLDNNVPTPTEEPDPSWTPI